MAIREVFDEINDVTVFFAEGEVAQISFKEISPADKYGNTHRAGIRVADDWVNNINIKVKEGNDPSIRFNAGTQGSPKWETLAVGDKVKVVVQPSEYNGKTYYNSGVSKIKLVKKGEGVAVKETPSGGTVKETYKPRDQSGQIIGHALKGGGLLVSRGLVEDIQDAAKIFHNATLEVKAWYNENNPNKLDEYSLGQGAGNAINTAAQYSESVDDLVNDSIYILSTVLPAITALVRGDDIKPDAKPAAKRGRKPAEKKVEKEPTDDDGFSPPFDPDLDDDIPF